jgi:dimethylhistidine N-methyltransferase
MRTRPVIANGALLAAAVAGLSAVPKTLEAKWLYDAEGSRLFEEITRLPEYYPTRTERTILEAEAAALAATIPEGAALVELGSGASVKTRLLLDAAPHLGAYVPVDISAAFLDETARVLAGDYPELRVLPVVADFTGAATLPRPLVDMPKVAFFPGSTLGNLDDGAATRLLARARAWPGVVAFILGVDLVKSPDVLIPAYDDAAGVTAAFNLNLLTRLNRETGATFDPAAFRHEARWNATESRIEMHLLSVHDQTVALGQTEIRFARGESVHTESSRKYTAESLAGIAHAAGWRVDRFLTDAGALFAVAILRPH